mmetsp:Transcript_10767/g.12115  ORF Transcript_10767/g.12115 Transcript_10767/m.12115 type:complete len:104 (-) Transcript_10767:40-351(-)
MILIGVAYSIYGAALWPMVPIIIKEEHLGTAFGITIAFQNAGLAFGSNIVGLIKSNTVGYHLVIVFLIGVCIIGIVSGVFIYFLNIKHHDCDLQKPTQDIMRA